MKESGLILNQENLLSLRTRFREESDQSSSTLSNSTTRRRRSSSILEDQEVFLRINLHKYFIGRMIVGKHACQQEEEHKGDISIVLIFPEQLFISELFKDIQDAFSLILHYKTI